MKKINVISLFRALHSLGFRRIKTSKLHDTLEGVSDSDTITVTDKQLQSIIIGQDDNTVYIHIKEDI